MDTDIKLYLENEPSKYLTGEGLTFGDFNEAAFFTYAEAESLQNAMRILGVPLVFHVC